MKKSTLIISLFMALIGTTSTAFAHDDAIVAEFGSFLGGAFHPIMGIDHLFAMLCVGILSYQLGGKKVWSIPALFVATMTMGTFIGIYGVNVSFVEQGIAFSVILLGIGIIFPQKLLWQLIGVGVLIFGTLHGYAHGTEIPSVANPITYIAGFLLASAVIHLLGVFIGYIPIRYKRLSPIVQTAGVIMSMYGILFLTESF